MRRCIIDHGTRAWLLCPPAEDPGHGAVRLEAAEAARLSARWFALGPASRGDGAAVAHLAHLLDGPLRPAGGRETLIARLRTALRTGRLRAYRLPREVGGGIEVEHEDKPARRVDAKKKDWIEIQLVDETGAPVAGVDYELTLPDGKIRRGMTDLKGTVRYDGIDPGVCDLTFPKLDQDAWEPA